jgi:hypothetical protein
LFLFCIVFDYIIHILKNLPPDTPVYIQGGHGGCIELLLTLGADISAARHDGATPFYIACLMGHLAVVKLIYSICGPKAFNDSTLDDWYERRKERVCACVCVREGERES